MCAMLAAAATALTAAAADGPDRYAAARALGCRCDDCACGPNGSSAPMVLPEIRHGAVLWIGGEAPGPREVAAGRPFVGASGLELFDEALGPTGVRRDQCSVSNAALCYPPGGDMGAFLARQGRENAGRARENKARRARGEEPKPLLLSPIEACRPRVQREVREARVLLILGAQCLRSVAGTTQGIGDKGLSAIRGFPFRADVGDGETRPALATYHPAALMGGGKTKRLGRRWRETWKSDVRKAVRMAYGRLEWAAPDVIWDPTLGQLDGALERLTRAECVGVDIETGPGPDGASGLDPERAMLRCVGMGGVVGGRAFGVCPGMVSIESPPRELLVAPDVVRERLRNFLARGHGAAALCGNNVNVFDRRVLDREGMPLPAYLEVWDATLLHSVTDESELPHSLDYQMSRYTDSPKHKPGGRGGGHEAWKRDVDLRTYCAYDAIGSAILTPRFVERVNACGMGQVYEAGVTLQRLCLNLRRAGIRIDPAEQARHGERLRRAMGQAQERAERAAVGGCPKLGSPQQIAHYLFERRGMQPTEHETEAGDPSTKEDALYEVLARRSLCVEDREFVEALLGYRRAQKKLGTFVTGLKPEVDGRVRCSWSAHSTVVGRVSCSDPINCLDSKTEVLTDAGWLPFASARGRLVAQWDDGQVSFVKPLGFVTREIIDEMVVARGQQIDLCMTPDHRCLLRSIAGKLRVLPARDYGRVAGLQLMHAGVFAGGDVRLTAAQVAWICAVQADGSWDQRVRDGRQARGGGVDFVLRKQRKIDRLLAALREIGARFRLSEKQTPHGMAARIRVQAGPQVDFAFALLGPNREFGPWLLDWSRDALTVFIDEVFRWDGCATVMNMYASVNKTNADWVQIIAAMSGMRANVAALRGGALHVVNITRTRDYSFVNNTRRPDIQYRGAVHCVTVPSGFIVTRRSGKIAVIGNCQTIPDTRRELDSLRSMFVAAPGNVLVGADADQLHIRIIAARANDAAWIDAFARGLDVHAVNAALVLRKPLDAVTKPERNLVKTEGHLFNYGGGAKKALAQMVKMADPKTGKRPFAEWTLGMAEHARGKYLAAHPALERWWREEMALWRGGQVPASFVLGRKRYFLDLTRGVADDESRSELVNHGVISTERDLLCAAIQRAMESIGWAWDAESRGRGMGGPGLILDMHDGLYAEVAESRAEEAKAALLDAITQTFSWGGRSVPITASAKVGRRWSDL